MECFKRFLSVIDPECRPVTVILVDLAHFPAILEHLHLSIVVDDLVKSLKFRRFDLLESKVRVDNLNIVVLCDHS